MLKSAWYGLSFHVNDVFEKSPTGRTSSRGTQYKNNLQLHNSSKMIMNQ
nr:MAG TPA_asm: hypothetical protein [Caudoviricetes sp.]